MLRLLDGGDHAETIRAEDAHIALLLRLVLAFGDRFVRCRVVRRFVVSQFRLQIGIELVHTLGVPGQRGGRHRAVDEDRQHGDAACGLEAAAASR